MSVFGLELEEPLPEQWTPLEVIVIATCLDESGKTQTFHSATPALGIYEALGLVRWTQIDLERGLMEDDDDE